MKQTLFYITLIILTISHASLALAWRHVSPYAYCAGDPVNKVDVDGDSTAVLINRSSAYGFGHMGVLFQNEEGKWDYYSKNGSSKPPTIGEGHYSTPDEFLESEDGKKYTEMFVIGDGRSYEEDAINVIVAKLNEPYSFLFSNCTQAVQSALKVAGISPGIPSPSSMDYNQPGSGLNLIYQSIVPKAVYDNIVNQNMMLINKKQSNFHYRIITR